MVTDRLSVMGMIFHAHHGLEHDEIKNGQRFEVDIDLFFDSSTAAKTDQLSDTIDVRAVYKLVQQIICQQRYFLIETVCQNIADGLLESYDIQQVTVKVRKPFAPLGGLANGTEIEITRPMQ